jgi:CheY-like chemotaxis protein
MVLLNDILDFSKIEAGHLTLEATDLALGAEVENVISLMSPQAQAKGLELRHHIDGGVPNFIRGDAVRLRQVLLNLVGNAIKFTQRGMVSLKLEPSPKSGGWIQASVTDTGVGIALAAQTRIFEPFVQADSSTTRQFGGTGLGLVISRCIVEAMGGAMWLDSEPGRGSTFYFDWKPEVLSACATPVAPELPASTGSAVVQFAGVRVLLAEDHPVNRQLALAQLKALGLTDVDVAMDGEQAVERVRHAHYDLILMDMQMPRMDGVEATRRLRQLPLAVQPWIVAMTANAYEDDRLACLAAGMNDFVSKPATMATLKAACTRMLENR